MERLQSILGDQLYGTVQAKAGVAGGQGHQFYEQYRVLPNGDPGRARLEAASQAYYDQVRYPGFDRAQSSLHVSNDSFDAFATPQSRAHEWRAADGQTAGTALLSSLTSVNPDNIVADAARQSALNLMRTGQVAGFDRASVVDYAGITAGAVRDLVTLPLLIDAALA